MMRNMSIAYDYATFRRPSQVAKEADLEQPQTATSLAAGATSETPTTPIPPEIAVCFQKFSISFPFLRYKLSCFLFPKN